MLLTNPYVYDMDGCISRFLTWSFWDGQGPKQRIVMNEFGLVDVYQTTR